MFSIAQDPKHMGTTPVSKIVSTATFEIDGQPVTLTRDSGEPIAITDFDTSVTTEGIAPRVAVASTATFEVNGQTVNVTRADGQPIDENDISLSTSTPGVAPVSVQASTATVQVDGTTVTMTRADGAPILQGDLLPSVSRPGRAPVAATPHTATFVINGHNYIMTRADGGAIDASMIHTQQTRAASSPTGGTHSTGSFDLDVNGGRNLLTFTHEGGSHSPVTLNDFDITETQAASGDANPTYAALSAITNPAGLGHKTEIHKPDGTIIPHSYPPEYFAFLYRNRKGVALNTDPQ